MTAGARIPHAPRPSRIRGYVAARVGPPVLDPTLIREVLDRAGLQFGGAPRNLRLGRRSKNMAVATDGGLKVVKQYRPQWSPDTVRYGHCVLERLEELDVPAPRLVRMQDGATWTSVDDGLFAVFDWMPGANYSLQFLRRRDRLRLTVLAGQTLARLHGHLDDGFEPDGRHHLGFAGATGPRRRDVAWHAEKLDELTRRSKDLPVEEAAVLATRLIDRAGSVLDEIERLERLLADVAFRRLVVHGDYGLHNLLFPAPDCAVPLDFELSRMDWRVNDLISALGKHRYNGGYYDFESMEVFLGAYARTSALSEDERRLLPQAWRLYKLQAAVQYWNSYFQTGGPTRKLASAIDSIGQADWVVEGGAPALERLVRSAEGSAPLMSLRHPRGRRASRRAGTIEGNGAAPDPERTVMQVTPNLEIGGAQETVLTLARYLPRTGHRTVVCSFGDGPLRRDIERLGAPLELLPERRHSIVALPRFLAEMLRRRRDLLDIVARHDVGIIQTQGLGTLDFLVMSLGIGRPLQVWWTIQNAAFTVRGEHLPRYPWLLRPKQVAHRWLYRLGTKVVDGVIAVSDETARSFRDTVGEGARDRISVVCNAVDVERYPADVDRDRQRSSLGLRRGDHVMTMVGTFKRQKGHRFLVEAVSRVLPRFPDLHVLLVGEGVLLPEIRRQVDDAELADRVHFLGSRRDVPELLAASDSFVLPSLWEGLPVALTEAMASQLPVIATAVSGTSQVMTDGETGWLVPAGDAAALAEAMLELLADPLRAADMAAAGRERVTRSFSAAAQAEQLSALFRGGARQPEPPMPDTVRHGTHLTQSS